MEGAVKSIDEERKQLRGEGNWWKRKVRAGPVKVKGLLNEWVTGRVWDGGWRLRRECNLFGWGSVVRRGKMSLCVRRKGDDGKGREELTWGVVGWQWRWSQLLYWFDDNCEWKTIPSKREREIAWKWINYRDVKLLASFVFGFFFFLAMPLTRSSRIKSLWWD